MNEQDSFEVSDPSDWLTTPLPCLVAVESGLRCQVCKDFYKTPMLTSCNHTFCSLCIRRALSNDGKCPLCRANEQEIRLRSNWSMEEVVAAFTKARPDVLKFAQKPTMPVPQNVDLPKRRLENGVEELREPKRLRSSARLSATRGAQATSEMAKEEADIWTPEEHEEADIDDGLVACPICLTRMKEVQVDKHLDKSCPGSPQPETSRKTSSRDRSNLVNGYQSVVTQSIAAKRPDRLPTVNYSMLKEQQLRKKLAELGISTLGDRKMLERRHREWMTIWNANCDALHPRKKSELLQDLNTWDNTLGSRAPTASRSINLGAQIKDKDFNHQAWSAKHDSSFKDLIANARKNVAKTTPDRTAEGDAKQGRRELSDRPLAAQPVEQNQGGNTGSSNNPISLDDGRHADSNTFSGAPSVDQTSPLDSSLADTNSVLDRIGSQVRYP